LGFNFRIDMKVGEKIKSFLSHNSTIKELRYPIIVFIYLYPNWRWD